MSLDELLRQAPRHVRDALRLSGISDELLSVLLDDLAAVLCGSQPRCELRDAARGHSIRARAAAISAIGESLSALAVGGAVRATTEEMSAVHGWVRSRLLACLDELAAESAVPASRDVALRKALIAAEILFIEFDTELRVRWTPDFERPPFMGRASVGRPAEEFLGRDDGGELTATLRRVLATGMPEQAEISLHPVEPLAPFGDGPLMFLVAIEPIPDLSGAIVGVLCASTNVTALERTRIALREAVGIRDLMVAVLAHDLRNPLSTVRALSSTFARSDTVPERVRQGLAHVESASRRMDELIGTLLDFSGTRAGGAIPVVRERSDVGAVTLAVIEELRQAMPGRLLTMDSSGDTSAIVDAARVAQVVSNLVGNALAHGSPAEAVQVTLDGSGPDLLLSVRNRGATIPTTILPVIFEPFRRGTGATSHPRGLGLGLYITREIVRAHQGTIAVESTDDRGTVFTVHLPRSPLRP
jgi:nitrogen-specific signal transduction histidine kinase